LPITATTEYGRKRAEYVVQRLREGATVCKIANELRITPSAVRKYYRALGIRFRKRWTRTEIQLVEHLMKHGVPYAKIADLFGVTVESITSLRRRYKLKHMRNLQTPWTKTELEALAFLHRLGFEVSLVPNPSDVFDLVAVKDGQRFFIDVKGAKVFRVSRKRLKRMLERAQDGVPAFLVKTDIGWIKLEISYCKAKGPSRSEVSSRNRNRESVDVTMC